MSLKPEYQPARLVKGAYRWYIDLRAPDRKRPTFNLNRILNLAERERRGYELCALINFWLSSGLSIDRFSEGEARRRKAEAAKSSVAPRGHTPTHEAIQHAVSLKVALLDNADSTRSYESHARLFIAFLESNTWENMPIDEIKRYHIVAFLDQRKIKDRVRNTTLNNNLISLSGLFSMLLTRGFVVINPCKDIPKASPEPKLRRPFTLEEAKIILPYIYDRDRLLLLAMLMEFTCYMRPKEIRQTKYKHIDQKQWVIRIPATIGKTGKKIGGRVATIPTSFLFYFKELIPKCSPNNYIFGKGYKPNQPEHCNKNRLYRRHQKHLKDLLKLELLDDIQGLTFYSWKDAGITEALDYIPLVGVQGQAGHAGPKMTLKYYKPPEINEHIRDMRNDVLPEK